MDLKCLKCLFALLSREVFVDLSAGCHIVSQLANVS